MRTSQLTVACPRCTAPTTLTLFEYVTGERAGEQEFAMLCPREHKFDQEELLSLWTLGRQ
jgi:hypothetical protein